MKYVLIALMFIACSEDKSKGSTCQESIKGFRLAAMKGDIYTPNPNGSNLIIICEGDTTIIPLKIRVPKTVEPINSYRLLYAKYLDSANISKSKLDKYLDNNKWALSRWSSRWSVGDSLRNLLDTDKHYSGMAEKYRKLIAAEIKNGIVK